MYKPVLSICIPSFNRPEQLRNLLSSIDYDSQDIEVCISEDFSPKRLKIREVVDGIQGESKKYLIKYHENSFNMGFDGNLRELVRLSAGKYIMFMGDDDLFVPNALIKYINFINSNLDKPYILRSYLTEHSQGRTEYFHYLQKSTVLPAGEETVAWLFKRSVNLCGFTILRSEAIRHETNALDGTLLYQVYLMAQTCLQHASIYCEIPVTHAVQSFRLDKPMFGSSDAEKDRYTPGAITHDNSLNFTKSYFEVTNYLDGLHGTNITKLVLIDLSKYSYPFLSIQRKRGVIRFLKYASRLQNEVGFGCTPYFHLYKWSLVIIGEKYCDLIIGFIKKKLGYTPNF